MHPSLNIAPALLSRNTPGELSNELENL